MGITIPELARLCGVSRGTIDRAINDRPGINPETRKRILQIARENGYQPNLLARSLVTGKSNSIGIIFFDFRNRHFAQLVDAIGTYLARIGYNCYICISEKDKTRECQIVQDLLARNVEGIIIMPINHPEDFDERFGQISTPIVAVNNRLSDRFSYVGADFAQAVYQGMKHFYQRGYRYVSFICPPVRLEKEENAFAQSERVQGYLRFLREHPDMQGEVLTTYEFMDTIRRDLQTIDHPGYFCSSDYYALQIRMEAQHLGLQIPKDFGLMGFDGIDTLDYIQPTLATVHYPAEEIGLAAIELLQKLMEGRKEPGKVLLPLTLREGQSI